MNQLALQMQQASIDHNRWQSVSMVYHATDETELTSAEKSETLKFLSYNGDWKRCLCSLFSCNLWNKHRPDISPYASNHVVISSTGVLADPKDYLLPIHHYPIPAQDPDKSHRSEGGGTYIEMVYVRFQDVDVDDSKLELTEEDRTYLEAWKLENHPFVQFGINGLQYRAIQDVWWIILTPYKVSIPSEAIWELDRGGVKVMKKPRSISNLVTLKLARTLGIFDG